MAARDYYDILGVKSDASDEEIQRREGKEKLEKEVRNGRQRKEG
jgi:DnaJ-class molecular chaperone